MKGIYVNRSRVTAADPGVCFVHEADGICRQVVDPQGVIREFPGVEVCRELARECAAWRWEPVVRCSMEFGAYHDGGIPVLWTIREEYFDPGDDWGFGREEYDQVVLAGRLNAAGRFDGPFRLYAIGKRIDGG